MAVPAWYCAAERAHELGLRPRGVVVEDVDVEVALGCRAARRAGRSGPAPVTSNARVPVRAVPDAVDVLPSLRDDARRLEKHAERAECGVDLHRILGLDAVALRAVSVALLDTALGVAPVAAHVPFADRATRHGTGSRRRTIPTTRSPRRARVRRRLADAPERLVAEHEPRPARRRGAVQTADDVAVGAADADRQRLDEHRAVLERRLGDVVQPCRFRDAGRHRQRPHPSHLTSRRSIDRVPQAMPGGGVCRHVHITSSFAHARGVVARAACDHGGRGWHEI